MHITEVIVLSLHHYILNLVIRTQQGFKCTDSIADKQNLNMHEVNQALIYKITWK